LGFPFVFQELKESTKNEKTMKRIITFTLILAPFLCALNAQETHARTLTISIENLKSENGNLLIALYTDETGFLKDIYQVKTLAASKGEIEATFENLPQGVYAVTVIHDKNGNGKLDTNFLGLLKEPIGASNEIDGRFKEPDWHDAKFLLTGNDRDFKIKF
jgi:uncharacterized protein (DUF2141 family)